MNMTNESGSGVFYRVKRPAFSQVKFDDSFKRIKKPAITVSSVKESCLKLRLRSFGFALFPSIFTLPSFYSVRLFLLDVLSGTTMAIFHIPQGMAYGVLAGLRPVNGLYTSFFPVLTYFLFGTSRHLSIGTFALAALMFSNPINRVSSIYVNGTVPATLDDEDYNLRLGLAMMLTFCIGAFQVLLGICQIGFLVTYISGPMISGFMCASAFHIMAAQFGSIFGIALPRVSGAGNLLIKTYNLFAHIKNTNFISLGITLICIVILYTMSLFVNPLFKKRFKFPIPCELLIIAVSTIISHFIGLNKNYNIRIVGDIPKGLPYPMVPSFEHFNLVITDIVIIGLATFAMTASIVKSYAAEFDYDVLYNQELLALGVSNIFGSFFSCFACCGALARSAVVVSVGMSSQIASLMSCALLLLVFYLIGPLLSSVPMCALSAIIIVALTTTFRKVIEFRNLCRVSVCDASVWMTSFLTTFFFDVPYGLVFGFGYAILTVLYRSQYGGQYVLGNARGTDLYQDVARFEHIEEPKKLKIIRVEGPVYFANVEHFESAVHKLSGVNPTNQKRRIVKSETKAEGRESNSCSHKNSVSCAERHPMNDVPGKNEEHLYVVPLDPSKLDVDVEIERCTAGDELSNLATDNNDLRYIILDASSWMFVDTAGIRTIKELGDSYRQIGIKMVIACLQPRLFSFFQAAITPSVPQEDIFFLTIHDAVLVAQANMEREEIEKLNKLPSQSAFCSTNDIVVKNLHDGSAAVQ